MSKTTVKVEGLRELEKQLIVLNDAVTARKAIQQALRAAARPMHEAAIAKAPVAPDDYTRQMIGKSGEGFSKEFQPGHVGRNIVLRKFVDRNSPHEVAGLVLAVKRAGWWGGFFERGGPHTPKQPFMITAFDEKGGLVIGRFADALSARIARINKKRGK